jgi:hypothetical protein
MTRIRLTNLVTITAVLLLSATLATGQTRGTNGGSQNLSGGWALSVVPDPLAPPVPPVQPAHHMVFFTPDGGALSLYNTVSPPGFISTGGTGNWQRTGNNEFEVTQKFAVATVDAVGGHDFGYFKQRLVLHYDASLDELSGDADFALIDLNGNVLFGGPFKVTLRRVAVERVGTPF